MSRRRRPHYRPDLGWILGIAFVGTLTRSVRPAQGFTCVRCCGSPRASSPHGLTAPGLASHDGTRCVQLPLARGCYQLAPRRTFTSNPVPMPGTPTPPAPSAGSGTLERYRGENFDCGKVGQAPRGCWISTRPGGPKRFAERPRSNHWCGVQTLAGRRSAHRVPPLREAIVAKPPASGQWDHMRHYRPLLTRNPGRNGASRARTSLLRGLPRPFGGLPVNRAGWPCPAPPPRRRACGPEAAQTRAAAGSRKHMRGARRGLAGDRNQAR